MNNIWVYENCESKSKQTEERSLLFPTKNGKNKKISFKLQRNEFPKTLHFVDSEFGDFNLPLDIQIRDGDYFIFANVRVYGELSTLYFYEIFNLIFSDLLDFSELCFYQLINLEYSNSIPSQLTDLVKINSSQMNLNNICDTTQFFVYLNHIWE